MSRSVRVSLSLKITLLTALLVSAVAGTMAVVLVYQFGEVRAGEMIEQDRELARMLALLRTEQGELDFKTLESFVERSDRVNMGLVYALELDRDGHLLQGVLNPRLFGSLNADYQRLVQQGREHTLDALAAGKVERQGTIKEYTLLDGRLRLGFELLRIDRQIASQTVAGLAILLAGLLIGAAAAVALSRRVVQPIRKLAAAMEAVASGDLTQTVQVGSHDELASLAESFNRMMYALREVKTLREVTTSHIAAPILERLIRAESARGPTTEERAVTVLSARLHGLPVCGGRLAAREIMSLLNDYLAPVVDAVHAHEGIVFDLGTDEIQVVWGASDARHIDVELGALRGALAACDGVRKEAARASLAGRPTAQLAVGISTGRAAIGNIGSAERTHYGVVGEVTFLARGIARLAQPGEILISEPTYTKVASSVQTRVGPPLIINGMDEAVPLYRVDRAD